MQEATAVAAQHYARNLLLDASTRYADLGKPAVESLAVARRQLADSVGGELDAEGRLRTLVDRSVELLPADAAGVLLRDEKAIGGWQSGLMTAAFKPKPAFNAFKSVKH